MSDAQGSSHMIPGTSASDVTVTPSDASKTDTHDWNRDLSQLQELTRAKNVLDCITDAAIDRGLVDEIPEQLCHAWRGASAETSRSFCSAYFPQEYGAYIAVTPQVTVRDDEAELELFYEVPLTDWTGGDPDVVLRQLSASKSDGVWTVDASCTDQLTAEVAASKMQSKALGEFKQRRSLHRSMQDAIRSVYGDVETGGEHYEETLKKAFAVLSWRMTQQYESILAWLQDKRIVESSFKVNVDENGDLRGDWVVTRDDRKKFPKGGPGRISIRHVHGSWQ